MSVGAGQGRAVSGQRACPQCGALGVVPIVFGLPSPELVESAERGEVSLGGCVVSETAPTWRCPNCSAVG